MTKSTKRAQPRLSHGGIDISKLAIFIYFYCGHLETLTRLTEEGIYNLKCFCVVTIEGFSAC